MEEMQSESIFYMHNVKGTQEIGTKQLCSLKKTTQQWGSSEVETLIC